MATYAGTTLDDLSITAADLCAAYPKINDYLGARAAWTGQIAEGQRDAHRAFRSRRGHKPEFAVPEDADDWKSILADFTLVVIFRSFAPQPEWLDAARDREAKAYNSVAGLQYRYDFDEDADLDDGDFDEARQAGREIRLVR